MEQNATPGQNTPEAQSASEKPRIKEVGNFELISKLGQGGMGAVYKARQKSLDRIVALKILPPSVAKDEKFIERFQGEARASAKLNHINIVKGIDVGQDPDNKLWYFAMEFIDGPSLQQILKKEGVLEEKRALKIVSEIASALECVDEADMVHRDIKPDNILLNADGTAKLADLGLAKDLHDDPGLTVSGQALGTPNYMAPEQARGELTELDIRTDIYSLGATLYHLVTGQPPFTGETSVVILTKHLTEMPTKANAVNKKVSAGCTKLIERMMQKKKEQRIQTPGEIVKLIKKILAGEDIGKALPAGPREHIPRSSISRGRIAAGAHSAPTQAKSRTPKIGLFAGGGVVAGVVVLLIALNIGPNDEQGGDRIAKLSPENVTATDNGEGNPSETENDNAASDNQSADEKSKRIEKLARAAFAYEKRSPNDFDGALNRYEQLLQALEKAPNYQEKVDDVQSAIKRVQGRRDVAAKKVWATMEETADTTAQKGQYDEAIRSLGDVPKNLASVLSKKADKKAAELRAEGEKKIVPILEEAEQIAKAGNPASALKKLETVEHIQLKPHSEQAQSLKKQYADQIVAAKDQEQQQRALLGGKKLEAYLKSFDEAIIDKKDIQSARKTAERAGRDSVVRAMTAQVSAMKALVDAYDQAQYAYNEALTGLKGKPFTVGGNVGTIEKVENGLLHVGVSIEDGKLTAKVKVPIKDLTPEQRSSLFQIPPPNSPAEKVVAAMLKLSKENEDLTGAQELLNAAGNFALAERYLDIIRVRQVGEQEAAAEKAWPTVAQAAKKPCDNMAQGKALLSIVDGYQQQHGRTKFALSKDRELSAIRQKANNVLDVKVFLSDLPEQEVKVGYPKFGKRGDLGYEGQRITVYGIDSPNGISTHPATHGNAHVAYMLEGRYGYFTSHVAINDSCGANGNLTPVTFKVFGDGKLLWQSKPVQRSRQNPQPPLEECLVDVAGVNKLELIVDCPGSYSHAHAVWVEPYLGTARLKR